MRVWASGKQNKTSRLNSGWAWRREMLTFENAITYCKHEIRNQHKMRTDANPNNNLRSGRNQRYFLFKTSSVPGGMQTHKNKSWSGSSSSKPMSQSMTSAGAGSCNARMVHNILYTHLMIDRIPILIENKHKQ